MIDQIRCNASTNLLLSFLPQGDRDLLAKNFSHTDLPTPQVLEQPNQPIRQVCFLAANQRLLLGYLSFAINDELQGQRVASSGGTS